MIEGPRELPRDSEVFSVSRTSRRDELRRNVDGLFELAEDVSKDLIKLKESRERKIYIYTIIVSLICIFLILFIWLYVVELQEFYFSIISFFWMGTWLIITYAINDEIKEKLESEESILRDLLVRVHGLLDNRKESFNLIEFETYLIRLKRLEFSNFNTNEKSSDRKF